MPMIDITIDSDNALFELEVKDVVDFFGEEKLLEEIGFEKAVEYWDFKLKEE